MSTHYPSFLTLKETVDSNWFTERKKRERKRKKKKEERVKGRRSGKGGRRKGRKRKEIH